MGGKLIIRTMQFVVGIGIVGCIVMGGAVIIAAVISGMNAILHLVQAQEMNIEVLREVSVEALEVADSVLLGLVLFIVGVGMYQLFFTIEDRESLPSWLRVTSLADMKEDIIAVTVVMLGISFLTRVVRWHSGSDIIYYGASIGIVLIPLVSLFLVMAYLAEKESEEVEDLRNENISLSEHVEDD